LREIDGGRLVALSSGYAQNIVIDDRLDGPVRNFGGVFWETLAAGAPLPALAGLGKHGVAALYYSDRYLVTPLNLALMWQVVAAAPGAPRRVRITTGRLDRPDSVGLFLFHSCADNSLRQMAMDKLWPAAVDLLPKTDVRIRTESVSFSRREDRDAAAVDQGLLGFILIVLRRRRPSAGRLYRLVLERPPFRRGSERADRSQNDRNYQSKPTLFTVPKASDSKLSSAKTFSGFMPEYSLAGRQGMGNAKIMMIDDGIADAGERNEGALPGLRSGRLDRRSFLCGSAVGFGALGLAGCVTSDDMIRAEAAKFYARAPDEKFPIPAVDISKIDPKYFRQTVRYDTKEAPGTIIVDPGNYFVYRIEGDGNATRYGANVGRPGFLWSGEVYVGRKAEWPIWTPPKEMIRRQPEARKFARGMPGGLDNPLGARALYLYKNGVYTVYTIYSTSDPETIGTGITSGCTGLLSQDMIDLYSRTPIKTKVVMLPA